MLKAGTRVNVITVTGFIYHGRLLSIDWEQAGTIEMMHERGETKEHIYVPTAKVERVEEVA